MTSPRLDDLRRTVHGRVLDRLGDIGDHHALRSAVVRAIDATAPTLDRASRSELIGACLDDLVGYGPFERYLSDDAVTEILYNGAGRLFVERAGQLAAVPCAGDDADVLRVVHRMLAPLGLRFDRTAPIVDARLPDGARLHAVLPPLAVDGPVVSIRRFPRRPLALSAFAVGSDVADLLTGSVRAGCNILVAGATGSGKTTLLGALAGLVADDERLVTVEETAELAIDHPHVVRLEARRANAEGVGAIEVRDLVRAALRMRPDRIVVGEVRAGEALDMLQACNTGHDGSFSTVHANSVIDALVRVETLALMADSAPPHGAVRAQVRRAIDLVVFTERTADGSGRRTIRAIAEVDPDAESYTARPLARRDGAQLAVVAASRRRRRA